MDKKLKLAAFFLVPLAVLTVVLAVAHGHNFALLNPKGTIATQERNLLLLVTGIMLVVVIPVFVLMVVIAWKYREGGPGHARYTPDWDHNKHLEFIWWGLPCVIIFAIGVVTWISSHQLDPYRPLTSTVAPVNIQVVALDWKWLFIYPDQRIATVNYVEFPAGAPVNFEITSDAPMNSFWIPQLGGQIYAMPGMSTELHLMADAPGRFDGSSVNISGAGFSGMRFAAVSVSPAEFNRWVGQVQHSPTLLTQAEYAKLSQPSQNDPPAYFAAGNDTYNLYNDLIMKYMMP